MSERDVRFFDDATFLEGLFDNGVSMDDGVRELVDNALDAGARNLWVILDMTQGERMHLIVGDDGEGIPDRLEAEGQGGQGIPFVMAVGSGKNLLGRRKGQIGAFGMGLSSTVLALARDTCTATVWSRNAGNEAWRSSFYNHADLLANGCKLPPEYVGQPPFAPPGDTGTVVDIELHGTENARPGAHQTRLLSLLGRTYRRHIAEGVHMSVNVLSAKKNDAKAVRRSDPLALDPEAHETKMMGQAQAYEVPPLVFDEDNPVETVTDPETGTWASITFRLSLIPRAVAMRRLEPHLDGKSAPAQKKVLKGLGIGHDGQGFSLLREGRELTHGQTFGVYLKHAEQSWMHGDIDFPTCLDHLFNVQTNKSRFDLPVEVKHLLKAHLKPYTDQVGSDIRAARENDARVDATLGEEPMAERIARRVRPMLPQPAPSKAALEKGEAMRAQQRDLFVSAAQQDFAQELARLEQAVASATTPVQREAAEAAEAEARDLLQEMINRIEHRWGSTAGARILEEPMGHQDLYEMRDGGDECHVVVNTSTPFHDLIYGPVSQDRALRGLLDIMLLSIGHAEFFDGKEDRRDLAQYWIRARQEVSLHAHGFIQAMPAADDGGEA